MPSASLSRWVPTQRPLKAPIDGFAPRQQRPPRGKLTRVQLTVIRSLTWVTPGADQAVFSANVRS
jgi:hypothetical protein